MHKEETALSSDWIFTTVIFALLVLFFFRFTSPLLELCHHKSNSLHLWYSCCSSVDSIQLILIFLEEQYLKLDTMPQSKPSFSSCITTYLIGDILVYVYMSPFFAVAWKTLSHIQLVIHCSLMCISSNVLFRQHPSACICAGVSDLYLTLLSIELNLMF